MVAEIEMRDNGEVLAEGQHFRPGIITCHTRNADPFRWMNIERSNLAQFDIDVENNCFDSFCSRFSDPRLNKASIWVDLAHQIVC